MKNQKKDQPPALPKGKLMAIGGNEDKGSIPAPSEELHRRQVRFFEHGILKRIHDELHGLGTRIEVITSASMIPEEMGQAYLEAFSKLGCDNVGILQIQEKSQADKPEYLQRLSEADAIMFTGGDQNRLTDIFTQTQALSLLKKRYFNEEKFLISGTSAGAMALSNIMIEGSEEYNSLVKGTVRTGQGLGLIDELIIDTHFINRRRMPRLIEAIAAFPNRMGIGLGEDTAILISGGTCVETIGSGLVVVLDGRHLLENNYPNVQSGEAICLEKLIMHVLPKGKEFWTNTGLLT